MTRPRFDPTNARGAATPAPADPSGALSVTALAAMVSSALEDRLPSRLRVVGEISGFTNRTHWYFRLKDEGAVIDCVMFASGAKRSGLAPREGQRVVLSGRIEFYAKSGRTQFYAETMDPIGEGELDRRFRSLCAEIKALGWFEAERKRKIPVFPSRIAVVTSRTGAALQDVLSTMARRCPSVEICFADVRVQGEGSAEQIARTLAWISERSDALGVEAILVTRGGGSIEDLWAFNERVVAEAIVASAVPVVAAIGHETDTTIAELVADARSATPTQAAVLLTPDRESLHEELTQRSRRLQSSLSRQVALARQSMASLSKRGAMADPRSVTSPWSRRADDAQRRLDAVTRRRVQDASIRVERLSARLAAVRPDALIAARGTRLERSLVRLDGAMHRRLDPRPMRALSGSLMRAMELGLERGQSRLASLERELLLAGPPSVLRRGYSLTQDARGRIVRSVEDATAGELLTTRVSDGTIRSRVEGDSYAAPLPSMPIESVPPRARRRSRRGSGGSAFGGGQPGLFDGGSAG